MNENTTFAPLKKLDGSEVQSALKIVKNYKKGGSILTFNAGAKEAEMPLNIGVVTTGQYEGKVIQKNPETGDESIEYRIRETDGTLVIIKGCASLNDTETGLPAVQAGELVQVTFNGMKKAKSGRNYAAFAVLRAVNAAE